MTNVKTAPVGQLQPVELRIRLLGPMTVTVGGRPVIIAAKKARALLGYLALREGAEVARSVLTGLLWGERSEGQARASLRQALSELKGALGGTASSAILATKEAVAWAPASSWIDARLVERAAGSPDDAALQEAAELAGGELMEGLAVGEPGFEQWLTSERERFRLLTGRIHARLMERAEQGSRLEEALTHGLKLISLDPLQEHVHRELMRLYAAQGRYDAALAQYERCRRELSEQLGVAPQPETEALVRSIRTSRREQPARSGAAMPPAQELEQERARSDRPSIAVLPFTNLSGNPEQDYFADGVVEDIISGLTRLPWLFVIARDSSFIYRGRTVDVRRVGQELGVRYLLEGSVRRAGDRIRIAGQLIDTAAGAHIWADRFDGTLSDIFDVQDRITASVVGAIEPKLRHAEIERARRKSTESVDAYDLFLRAVALNTTRKREDNEEALRLLYRAVEIDPRYAAAYALAGYCYTRQFAQRWISPSDPSVAEGVRMARLASEHGQDDPEALWMAGVTLAVIAGDLDEGVALTDRSVALNPNAANGLMASGLVHAFRGDSDGAVVRLERSRQLSPLDPIAYGASLGFAWAHFMAGRYEEAAAWCATALHEAPPHYLPALAMKIVCCGLLGQLEEGRTWVERLLTVNPDTTVSSMLAFYQLTFRDPQILKTLCDGLRKAGLPE